MRLERFEGRSLGTLLDRVRRSLGPEGLVLRTRITGGGGSRRVELVAVPGEELAALRRRLEPPEVPEAPRSEAGADGRIRPLVVAVVGPPGVGKTSTVVKLALHPRAFGGRRVGILTLDTYRVGALEEIQSYTEIAGIPLEVAYHRRDVDPALRRMRDREVILVDAPGRWPPDPDRTGGWSDLLARIEPDEAHLALPAWGRPERLEDLAREASASGASHALLTQVDRAGDPLTLLEAAEASGLPLRWVATGPELPGDLATARDRILGAVREEAATAERRVG